MTVASARPGYYPDPTGSGLLRWWDGQQWTAAVVQPQPVVQPQQPSSDVEWTSAAAQPPGRSL